MKTRSFFVWLGLLGGFAGLFGQQAEVALISADDAAFNGLKRLILPAGYSAMPLPSKKDNTREIYFSGIYNQWVWNCNQAASIWTMFTYEINYLRNLNSSQEQNQYSPMAVYNLLNRGRSDDGVSYFDSWNLVKANGIPASQDFPVNHQDGLIWVTGYDKYYHGMKNRVDEVFAIDVGNPEGLLTLKHWINDHLNGSQVGGLANFQIGSGDMIIPQIPLDKGLEEEGQYIVIRYGPEVGHAMTFAGWNDSIRYDVNDDGRYTNDIDINGDGVVTMEDWEIGAMLVVNSWGSAYNNGKLWVMYRLLAAKLKDGGIWNNAAMVVKPKKTFEPLLTVKAKIRYNERNRIKIQVGVASDLNATGPEKVMDFPCFNFQGDAWPMQGFLAVNSDLAEIGLDITPLMNYFPENGKARIFLQVIQKSTEETGSGKVESFAVMDYTNGTHEFANTDGMVPIAANAVTQLSVPVTIRVNRPQIITEELPGAQVGQEYEYQLEAIGTTGPYRFDNPASQFVEKADASTIHFNEGAEVFTQPDITARVMDLPFSFPLYGETYNQVTVLQDGGIVMGQKLVKYPYDIDKRLRFYQNTGVFPFFGILHYPNENDRVTFDATSAAAIIRWHATVDFGGLQPVEFAVRIQPDGKIWFYYGNMDVSPDIAWISGISAGNGKDYYLMDHNSSGLQPNTGFSLGLLDWPSWLSLESNGDLLGTPDKPGTWTLPLKVTDYNGISSNKELIIKASGGSGVANGESQNAIRVFPNPATDAIWFQGYTDLPGSMSVILYDQTGKKVFSRKYNTPGGQVSIAVREIKSLPAGVYIYQIKGIVEGAGRIIRQ